MVPNRVVFSPTVPPLTPNNAGEHYLNLLETELVSFESTYVVPSTPQNESNAAERDDIRVILVEDRSSRHGPVSAFDRLLPSRPMRNVAHAIRQNTSVVSALKRADLVDLQWPELVALAPLIRQKLPHVRIVATVHDLHSQKFKRQFLLDRRLRLRVKALAGWARASVLERRSSSAVDLTATFSEKDSLLLPATAAATVIYPALSNETSAAVAEANPFVLFVGPLHRRENLDGLVTFLESTWPKVRKALPDARLLVAGRKPTDPNLFAQPPGVELLGFVEDLTSLYDRASAVMAPLRLGAGLKFKSIDALVRGVPLIGTSTALEGVDSGDFPITPFDEVESTASAVVEALLTTPPQRNHVSASWYQQRYGPEQFKHRVQAAYGVVASLPSEKLPPPEVSVVIPVWNGELGISEQLDRLAFQIEAPLFEVVVADNGSTDRTRATALAHRGRFLDLRVVDASAKRGVNYARNIGALNARADKVLICDHDDLVGPHWVATLSQALDSNDLVGGKTIAVVRQKDGRLKELPGGSQTLGTSLGYLPYALGGNLGVRRTAFLNVKGFDQSFVGGHDEVEFSWRMQEHGASIAAAEGATLRYLQRETLTGAYRQAFSSSRTRIQLWSRYHASAALDAISYRGAVDSVLRALGSVPGLVIRRRTKEGAQRLGRAFGGLTGQYRYRIRGAIPIPDLLDEGHPPLPGTENSTLSASNGA